jgi:hypothetical protein
VRSVKLATAAPEPRAGCRRAPERPQAGQKKWTTMLTRCRTRPRRCARSTREKAAAAPESASDQCQWQGSVLLHPWRVASAPLLWRDWSRRLHRRVCMHLLRYQRVEVQMDQTLSARPAVSPSPLSRAQRAHARLSWPKRLAHHARVCTSGPVTVRRFGVPEHGATLLGLATA